MEADKNPYREGCLVATREEKDKFTYSMEETGLIEYAIKVLPYMVEFHSYGDTFEFFFKFQNKKKPIQSK